MSRVLIKDIYYDGEVDSSEKVKNIEVVPRKMVEMIIEKCKNDLQNVECNLYMQIEASRIENYAESLLEQFEED